MSKCNNPNCKCENCQCGDNCQCGEACSTGEKCCCGDTCDCADEKKESCSCGCGQK